MSEQPQTFNSFEEAFPSKEPKPQKRDNRQLGGMLLDQMAVNPDSEGEKLPPEDFIKKAIDVGWRNNPKRKPGDPASWGPTIADAFEKYFGNEADFDKILADLIASREVGYISEKNGKGYMLKINRQE